MKSENEIVQSIAAQECAAAQHRSVTYFEDAPCYPIEKLVKLHGMRREMLEEQDEAKQRRLAAEYHAFMDTLEKLPDAPSRIYLWPEGNMPATGEYTELSLIHISRKGNGIIRYVSCRRNSRRFSFS